MAAAKPAAPSSSPNADLPSSLPRPGMMLLAVALSGCLSLTPEEQVLAKKSPPSLLACQPGGEDNLPADAHEAVAAELNRHRPIYVETDDE